LSTNTTPSQAESTPAPPNPALPLGEGGGNKYLNALRDEILRHKFYPPTAELFGWQGETRYQIVIDRQGRLVRLRVLSSSGYDILDKAGFIAIQQAAPFAPIPSNLWPNVDPVGLVFIADWSKDSQ
jgi:protein TonB